MILAYAFPKPTIFYPAQSPVRSPESRHRLIRTKIGRREATDSFVAMADIGSTSAPGIFPCLSRVEECQSPRFVQSEFSHLEFTSQHSLLNCFHRFRILELCLDSMKNLVRSDFSNKSEGWSSSLRIETGNVANKNPAALLRGAFGVIPRSRMGAALTCFLWVLGSSTSASRSFHIGIPVPCLSVSARNLWRLRSAVCLDAPSRAL